MLRGEMNSAEWLTVEASQTACLAAAYMHGVTGLLAQRMQSVSCEYPPGFQAEVTRVARAEAVIERGRQLELSRVLSSLHEAGVSVLIIKGAALAYTHYSHPSLRPRNDTDLLIEKRNWCTTTRVLRRVGYERRDEIRADIAKNQGEFVRDDRWIRHVIDLHWHVSDRPVFAAALDFETLVQQAMDIPALGPFARTPAPVHALLLACMHRVRHYNSDLLMWLHDIHLLATRLSRQEAQEFVALARHRKVSAICADGLRRAADHFHTETAAELSERLLSGGGHHNTEPSARYLILSPWRARLLDVMTQPGWVARLRYLREIAASNPQYLLDYYGYKSKAWLPALHARRLLWRTRNLLATLRPT